MTKLTRQWYNILQKDGFEDIEEWRGEYCLKQWSSSHGRFAKAGATYFYMKQDYYYYAAHFAAEHVFNNELERTAWFMHSQGVGVRDIADSLRKKKGPKPIIPNKDSICRLIVNLKKEFLKYWQSQADVNAKEIHECRRKGHLVY